MINGLGMFQHAVWPEGLKILKYFTINGLAEHVGGVSERANAGLPPCSFHGARGGAPKGKANGWHRHDDVLVPHLDA